MPSRRSQLSAPPTARYVCAVAMILIFISWLSCNRREPPAETVDSASDRTLQTPAEATDAAKADLATHGSAAEATEVEAPTVAQSVAPAPDGRALYTRHCAACHGEQGDGSGVAARFLFPKPRNMASGSFRLVSTRNNVPTRDDLHAVLLRGMPGSAMPPWKHLAPTDRDALVDEVLRLRAEGARKQYTDLLREAEQLTDEELADEDAQEEIQSFVDDRMTPGETSEVPPISPVTDEALARGKVSYETFCQSCHGKGGTGDGVKQMFDEDQLPTSPRDFTRGIFKGGHDAASIYRRIAYGMPGTPMPATSQLPPEQMLDLVHYIRSLSSEEQREQAVLNRDTIVVRRVERIPDEQADSWSDVEPVGLRMTPLWWRNDSDRDLKIQAVHDGATLAVRMSWQDSTANKHALRSEAFEDAVAMEVYRGDAEPFVGMGDPRSPIDVWFWDADRQRPASTVEQEYPRIVADIYPLTESSVATAEYDRPGTKLNDQSEVSLPALASGNQIVPAAAPAAADGASTLTVGGPGSVTFRIPRSQLVTAHGEWTDGRWNVLLRRSLTVPTEADGISLAPGETASAAFAVWDGEQRDRDGKKLITIWQDLQLEP